MRERKLFSRRDALFLGALVLLCALLFWGLSRSPRGTTALVERNGELLLRQDLSQLTEAREVPISGENGVSLTVALYPDGAAVTASSCPDKTCIQTGKITRAGESAICLPARVSVRLEGAGGTDAETY